MFFLVFLHSDFFVIVSSGKLIIFVSYLQCVVGNMQFYWNYDNK